MVYDFRSRGPLGALPSRVTTITSDVNMKLYKIGIYNGTFTPLYRDDASTWGKAAQGVTS